MALQFKYNAIEDELDLVQNLSETIALADLSDVTITAAASNDFLVYNGTAWVDYPLFSSTNTWTGTNDVREGWFFGRNFFNFGVSTSDANVTVNIDVAQAVGAIVTFPILTADDTFAVLGTAQTFTGAKIFSSTTNTVTGQLIFDSDALEIKNPAGTFEYKITGAAIAADRILNLPLISGTDTLATLGLAQTFTGNNTFSGITTGGASNWHFNPSNFTYLFDEFSGNSTSAGEYSWSNQSSGTGATVTNITAETNHPGIRQFNTGTTTTGYSGLNTRTSFIDPNGGDVFITLARLSANTGIILRIGLQDTFTGADVTDGYYFEFNPGTSANWLICTANNSTRTKTTSSSAVSASTWYKLEIRVNSANTSVEYFVNDVSIGTVATNLPASGRDTGISGIVQNDGVSIVNVTCDLDYIYYYNKGLVR